MTDNYSISQKKIKSKNKMDKLIINFGKFKLNNNLELDLKPVQLQQNLTTRNTRNTRTIRYYSSNTVFSRINTPFISNNIIDKYLYYIDINKNFDGFFIKDFNDGYRFLYFKNISNKKFLDLFDKIGFNYIKQKLYPNFLGYYYLDEKLFIFEKPLIAKRVCRYKSKNSNINTTLIKKMEIYKDHSINNIGFLVPSEDSIIFHNNTPEWHNIHDNVYNRRPFFIYKSIEDIGYRLTQNLSNIHKILGSNHIGIYFAGKKTKNIYSDFVKSLENVQTYNVKTYRIKKGNNAQNNVQNNLHYSLPPKIKRIQTNLI